MAEPLMVTQLRADLSAPESISESAFAILKRLCLLANSREDTSEANELVLRALEHRDRFGAHRDVLDSIARKIGLFPFLNPQVLDLSDQLAYEFHRPLNMEADDVVFHRVQAQIYRDLLSGTNVILRACPESVSQGEEYATSD